jgi:two-component system, OmpR family, phosphate regulon sensor histidine kinase PhoR
MRSSIFKRLILAALALVLTTAVAVEYTLTRYATNQQAAGIEIRLTGEARILAREAASVPRQTWMAWARDAARLCGSRVEMLDNDGRVLADSGLAVNRDSRGGGISVTARVLRPDGSVALRLSTPVDEVDQATNGFRLRILAISLLSSLLALALAYFISRSLIRRVRRLKQLAEGLLDVPRKSEEASDGKDDMGALELSFARVAAQVRSLVDRLRLESARREAILASMAEGVLAVDSDLRVIFANDAVIRAVGGSRRLQGNTRLLELIRDTGLFEMLREVVKTGETRKHRLKITSDKERSFEVQAGPLEMPSGSAGAIAILYDVTDLERLEQVRKDFVANVSHEMRTPLAGIIGYSETLMDGALEDKENNRRFVQIIHSNAIRLNSIASDLLVLSELESKVDPPEAGRIAVRDVVESALAIVEKEAEARGVTLISEEIQDLHVMGTRLRLEQAVLNLVANAIKFNQPGGEVRIRVVPDASGEVSITVSDTGVGIPSQDLPRIFERFYRVDKGRSRQVGGTGLGLTIVKHVIERMNGTIEVQSQLRHGSTFTVRLPIATHAE